MIARVDGSWVAEEEARVPIDDRGFLFGAGVFDTCRLYDGRWLHFDDHARRLHASAEVLRIPPPPIAELRTLADELLRKNDPVEHGVLRMTLTRGSPGGPPRLVMTLRALPADWRDIARRGWRCITAANRHPPAAVMPPRLKGQGRVFSLLAALEAEAAGCDQALLLSLDGHVTEGATWNVFWRLGDVVRTPSEETGLLPGVTRSLVMEQVQAAGYTLETGVWDQQELQDADEIFGTMTSLGIVPITELDGRTLPEPRAASDVIAPRFWDRVAGGQDG
jgi:branched-subunit amino acid aminotransferase/4-amino-4-deoxychorismate lyase